MINYYFYDNQLRKYIEQFCGIFAGLSVMTGVGADGNTQSLNVPIRYGSMDRVAAAISVGNTQNKPIALPLMSAYMIGIEQAPERRKGVGQVDRKTVLPAGGVYPDDLRVYERMMPVPYNLVMELAIYASNTDQAFQILEQLMMIFDPTLQIQTSDAPFDWTKLTTVTMESIQGEENFPPGAERRLIVWTMNFTLPIWISPPMDIKTTVVRSIVQNLGDMNSFSLGEYDQNGELQAFGNDGSLFTSTIGDTSQP